jgi:subtilisin-like proprotein convertase family protein
VVSAIDVSGAGAHLTDVDAITELAHTFSADLDMTLTSPEGTTVTLTTDNGGSADNVFDGTVWDDDADPDGTLPLTGNEGVASDHPYADNVLASPLVPEEAMAAFAGEDPNGTWKLAVRDDLSGDIGTLASWGLVLQTLPEAPTTTGFSASAAPALEIPDNGSPVTATLDVAGAGAHITDLDLTTTLPHTAASQVEMTLTSPAGTVVTLTTDNGAGADNVFNGTVWDDDASPGGALPYGATPGVVTDHPFANNVAASPLAPEEAMGALAGEDPNGTWTLTARDDAPGDTGTVSSWQLDGTTGSCQGPALVSIADVKVREETGRATKARLPVTLASPSTETVEVTYATARGSARRGDFKRTKGLLTFPAGETEKVIKVLVAGDAQREGPERFTVNVTAFSNAIVARGIGTVTIRRSDLR